MTPEQEGARGDIHAAMEEADRRDAERRQMDEADEWKRLQPWPRVPAPSPHEGEAARCDTCGGDDPGFDRAGPGRMFFVAECSDPFHDPAPTEPRSISEEQLERLRKALRDNENDPEETALLYPEEITAVRDLLAAHEQAESQRDTAQASEARLREALERIARLEKKWSRGPVTTEVYELAREALASTPNPEERACTCPPSAFTGYYTPANSCPRHGSAPDPTPEQRREAVIHCATTAYSGPLLDGPLEVTFTFYRERPKGHYRTGKNASLLREAAPTFPVTRPDALKLARAAEDALTGVLWRDDSQIVDEHLHKRYGSPARVEIEVSEREGRTNDEN